MATRRLGGIATSSSVPDNGGDNSGGGGSAGGYVDDVFSTYLYVGTGADDHDIENGVDLEGEGGLVWIKGRTNEPTSNNQNVLFDTARGSGKSLYSDLSNLQGSEYAKQLFTSSGFTLPGNGPYSSINSDSNGGINYVSWTFRKAPSFFDVVLWTGDSVDGREIPHNLGCVPGMVIVKSATRSSNWSVLHKDAGLMYLNDTGAAYGESDTATNFGDGTNRIDPTSTEFTIGKNSNVNQAGDDYVAYLFAHDDSDESMIKCGSYTGTGATQEIDLGWEPQFLLIKSTTYPGVWAMHDSMRGLSGSADFYTKLMADSSTAEYSTVDPAYQEVGITPTGFQLTNSMNNTNGSGQEYIYMAIRRPNKPAEEFDPEELFAINTRANERPSFVSGFPVDLSIFKNVTAVGSSVVGSRLIQGKRLYTDKVDAQSDAPTYTYDYMDGWFNSPNEQPGQHSWMWRRAPGFFDSGTYTGTQVITDFPHSLNAIPEMIWIKRHITDPNGNEFYQQWHVYHKDLPVNPTGYTKVLYLNAADSENSASCFVPDEFTNETWRLGTDNRQNNNGEEYSFFMWASVPGICDIGSYTGTGATQYIDCGFTNSVRFVLIKRADSPGDWMYWDTLRGIVSGMSPYLTLNTTAAQVDAFRVYPYPAGFQISDDPSVSTDGGKYIYMAIA